MEVLVKLYKNLLHVVGYDDEDDKNLEDDIRHYIEIVNSTKYADSNSDTTALEKMVKMANGIEVDTYDLLKDDTKPLPGVCWHVEEDKAPTSCLDLKDELDEDRNFVISRRTEFMMNLGSHLQLLKELQGETATILPGQPAHQMQRFRRFNLRPFNIPEFIFKAMENNDASRLNLQKPLTMDNYVIRNQALLWIEEAHQAIEMRKFDMHGVMLGRQAEGDFFLLVVPGLAEGRPSLMRGDKLILKSDRRSSYYEGYIHDVRERDILIKLHASLHSTAMDGLRFDVSFQSSRTPFRRCHHAVLQFREQPIVKAITFPLPRDANEMARPLIDVREADADSLRCFMRCLNVYQRKAVINVMRAECRPAPYIIFGPPGTGKTVTMVEAILQVYARKPNSRLLVCGNSNACADLIATRIKSSGVVPREEMIRLMAFYRMEKMVPPELEDISIDIDGLGEDNYEQCRIMVTTCIHSGCLNEYQRKFDYVFVDEAGHASEPEVLIPIGMVKQDGCIVLAGDHHQLGPVVISHLAGRSGLNSSLLERLSRRSVYQKRVKNGKMTYDERYLSKLIICYRSDPRVMCVNNKLFYDNELKFNNETPQHWMEVLNIDNPLVFHMIKGRDRREYLNPSWFNPNEAIACLSYVKRLYGAGLMPEQLGIITPYRRQIEKLNLLFDSCRLRKCKIATMEEFQGDEREVIIISTVRTREKNLEFDIKFNLGFLFNPKRFNVAVSRAKWLVIVVGDPKILTKDDCWTKYIEAAHHVVPLPEQPEPQKPLDDGKPPASQIESVNCTW